MGLSENKLTVTECDISSYLAGVDDADMFHKREIEEHVCAACANCA
jgi:hypothetical protein